MRTKEFLEYHRHSRKVLHSFQQRQHVKKGKRSSKNALGDFWFTCLYKYESLIGIYYFFRYLLSPKAVLREYSGNEKGIFKLNEKKFTVGLVSDWATGTDVSKNMGDLVRKKQPEITIHMGDIYYVGHKEEVSQNFGTNNGSSDWPYGSWGSLAIPGNHEYLSNGSGFFDVLLPMMNLEITNKRFSQEASFFCLENDYWRIIGLDTGYHSVKVEFSAIKLSFWQDAHLDEKILQWLEKDVKLKDTSDKRGIILLTHHQPASGFEESFTKITEQLSGFFSKERPIIWLWGHEHRLSFYGVNKTKDTFYAFGRCIGHGGMPVEVGINGNITQPEYNCPNMKLVAYDSRKNPNHNSKESSDDEKIIGYNGFALLHLDGEKASIEYYDDCRQGPFVQEDWKVDLTTGKINGTIKEIFPKVLSFHNSALLTEAVTI